MRRYAIPAKTVVIPNAEEEEKGQRDEKQGQVTSFPGEPERAESKNVIEP